MVQARPIGSALLVVGIICGVASTAIDYWYYLNETVQDVSVEVYFGLWELCVGSAQSGEKSVCLSWSDVEDEAGDGLDIAWLHACQAMMIIGLLLSAVAILNVIIAQVKKTSARVAQVTSCIGGICYIIAAAIFGAKYEEDLSNNQVGGTLHAGFGLAIVAAIFNLIPAILIGQGPGSGGYQNV